MSSGMDEPNGHDPSWLPVAICESLPSCQLHVRQQRTEDRGLSRISVKIKGQRAAQKAF